MEYWNNGRLRIASNNTIETSLVIPVGRTTATLYLYSGFVVLVNEFSKARQIFFKISQS
jgi:hypothetical protein